MTERMSRWGRYVKLGLSFGGTMFNFQLNRPSASHPVSHCRSAQFLRGFTLIEMLVTTAMVGIIAVMAVPSYQGSVEQLRIGAAQGDLIALSLRFEQFYNQYSEYPELGGQDNIRSLYARWAPASSETQFVFSAASEPQAGYKLVARGVGSLEGCVISLETGNVRSSAGCMQGENGWI